MDYQITYRGLTMGPGTDYELNRVEGFFERSVDVVTPDLPRYHGGLVGASYHNPRTIVLDIDVVGEAYSAGLVTQRWDVMEAFQPLVDSEDSLVLTLPSGDSYQIDARVVRGGSPITINTEAGIAKFLFELTASDPAIYSETEVSVVVDPFTSASGFAWPAVWPISWGAGGSGGGATLELGGEWESWPTYEIHGPTSGTMSDPVIEQVTQGTKISFTAHGGVSMTSGQVLVVETAPRKRSAAFTTGQSRYGQTDGSTWAPLEPGSNEIRFRASGTTTGAFLVATARSARI